MSETQEMTVIERAARALQTAWDKHDAPAMLPPLSFTDNEGRYLVRAVLQAIREPSLGMKDRGGFICSPCSDNPVRWKVLNRGERNFSETYATDVYQAMIDAALSE